MKLVTVRCPSCGEQLSVSADISQVSCKVCGHIFSAEDMARYMGQADEERNGHELEQEAVHEHREVEKQILESKERRAEALKKWEEKQQQAERRLVEAQQKQRDVERAQEKARQRQQEEENERKRKTELAFGAIVGIGPFLLIFVLLFSCSPSSSESVVKEGVSEPAAIESVSSNEEAVTENGSEDTPGQSVKERVDNPIRFEKDGVNLAKYTWVVTDNDGYEIEKTMTITGWVHGNDEASTSAAWAAVGGIDRVPEYTMFKIMSQFSSKPDDCVIVYGCATARNITPGFSITAGNPHTEHLWFLVEPWLYPGAFCYQTEENELLHFANAENFNDWSKMPDFILTSDDIVSIRFAVAFHGGAATPNNPSYDPMLDSARINLPDSFKGSRESDYWVGCPDIVPGVAF